MKYIKTVFKIVVMLGLYELSKYATNKFLDKKSKEVTCPRDY